MLQVLKRKMSKGGVNVFHTFPTQFDLMFYGKYKWLRYMLFPFRKMSEKRFTIITKIYACIINIAILVLKGKTFSEYISKAGHCNPTTVCRLTDVLKRAGYEILTMSSMQLYDFEKKIQQEFKLQSITHRNICGVASPISSGQ